MPRLAAYYPLRNQAGGTKGKTRKTLKSRENLEAARGDTDRTASLLRGNMRDRHIRRTMQVVGFKRTVRGQRPRKAALTTPPLTLSPQADEKQKIDLVVCIFRCPDGCGAVPKTNESLESMTCVSAGYVTHMSSSA
mmetsp:Transcript_18914/g.26342  ORF Transcript_18914/g.26342 Transcript_18914/m.26342 type:complete len:136 (+) Transcript_18914:922-1329(+)